MQRSEIIDPIALACWLKGYNLRRKLHVQERRLKVAERWLQPWKPGRCRRGGKPRSHATCRSTAAKFPATCEPS
jgi:hypothetical protein